mgnify:FL=1
MKLFWKILIILLILIVILFSIFFLIGYSTYSKALDEKPLVERIEEVTNMEHFVKFDDMADYYRNAVIAIEDHRYYEHGPIEIRSIARAIFNNIKAWDFVQGGSTITQQVAKNIILSQEKTLSRKLAEVIAAFDLEKNYSKKEIFELYVNTANFGNGYIGIYAASMGYYNKEPKDLDLNESSMLAGVPNAPSVYAPNINPTLAKQRQTQVINAMLKYGYISNEQALEVI